MSEINDFSLLATKSCVCYWIALAEFDSFVEPSFFKSYVWWLSFYDKEEEFDEEFAIFEDYADKFVEFAFAEVFCFLFSDLASLNV